MKTPLLTATAPLLLGAAAAAQQPSLYIDIGSPMSPAGSPSSAYGAAAGTPGFWNLATDETLPPYEVSDLVDALLAPATSGVSLTHAEIAITNGIGDFDFDHPATFGDEQALLDDLQDIGLPGAITEYTFTGLPSGSYDLFVYAWSPDDASYASVVTPEGGSPVQLGGNWPGALTEGITHSVHCLSITDGDLWIRVESVSGFAGISGIQLIPSVDSCFVPEEFDEACNGDGGDQMGCTFCPCSNEAPQGTTGGCLNSAGTSARLLGTGSSSVSTSDLRLEMSGAPPFSFGVLFSGDAVAPTNVANPCFGQDSGVQSVQLDGLRCVVSNTRRHGGRAVDSNGNAGATSAGWGPPDGPVNGIPGQAGFTAGQTRHFQVTFRDFDTMVCMTGLNTTQQVEVNFTP